MRPSGRPVGFLRGEIMHLNVRPARPCTLKGPLVLPDPAVSTRLGNGSWFCWPLLPGQRLGEGGGSSSLALNAPISPGSPDLSASLVPGWGSRVWGGGGRLARKCAVIGPLCTLGFPVTQMLREGCRGSDASPGVPSLPSRCFQPRKQKDKWASATHQVGGLLEALPQSLGSRRE